MLRLILNTLLCVVLCSCSGKQALLVDFHVDGAETVREQFQDYEDAAEWISERCHPLWKQAAANGFSSTFQIVVSGLTLSGEVHSPDYRFEQYGQNGMRLVQLDGDNETHPKIEGASLAWDSARRYISDELITKRLFEFNVANQE